MGESILKQGCQFVFPEITVTNCFRLMTQKYIRDTMSSLIKMMYFLFFHPRVVKQTIIHINAHIWFDRFCLLHEISADIQAKHIHTYICMYQNIKIVSEWSYEHFTCNDLMLSIFETVDGKWNGRLLCEWCNTWIESCIMEIIFSHPTDGGGNGDINFKTVFMMKASTLTLNEDVDIG